MTVMTKLAGKDFKTAYYKYAEGFKGKHDVMSKEIEYIKHSKDNFQNQKIQFLKILKVTKWPKEHIREYRRKCH